MEQVISKVENMNIENGQTVIFKTPNIEEFTLEFLARLQDYFASKGLGDCLILLVDEVDDVQALDEKEMNKHGWYRK